MKKRILALALSLALCLGLFAGCGGDNGSNGGSGGQTNTGSTDTNANTNTNTDTNSEGDPNAAGGEITIAFIGNTTGDAAEYGLAVRNGAMLYIDQLNKAGGINGKTVKVLEYDDKGDPQESVNAFNLAMEKGITAVIGSVLTAPTMSLADASYEAGIPQITASATAAGVTMIDPEDPNSEIRSNVFRACFIDPFQGEKMADYAYNKLGARTAAVFYETGVDYSEGLMNAFVEKAGELGLEIVATEAFATGDTAYQAQMTNIAAVNPDVIYCPFYYTQAGLAVSQGRQAGVTGTFVGGDGFGTIKDFASAEDLEGTVYCSGYAPGTESVAQFEADYKAAYGADVPNMFAPLAYDAALLMCEALKAAEDAGLEAGSEEYRQTVIDTLKNMNGTEGITGTYAFDEYNNPIKSAAIIQLTNGDEVFKEMY